jgi:superfamily I DNA and/or RNA helicase
MKIKNIRQYRTFYKENVRDLPNRNEHHMGTFRVNESGKREFGWFEVYHGDKEGYGKAEQGIGNFLQSFLDMAKDGQAVYEFLQNAVDAGASHFTMAWGRDQVDGHNYVLIANNGKMFDFDSIRSILNVGSSTKTTDSQSIGKFGIGFKLAHRLVGKENGLDELLSAEPSGPILFSWKNGEILNLAENVPNPEPIEINFDQKNDKIQILDNHPWLFKILITCFPALPENKFIQENIILTNGELANTPVFSNNELNALHRWVSNYRDVLNNDTYKEGSLFFIKLGTGKENDLADKNLAEGVRFSLAILQETAEADKKAHQILSTLQLNKNEPIHKPDLHYHYFKITKNEHLGDYLYVRFGVRNIENLTDDQKTKFEKEDDIEVLFGFRGYNEIGDYFKGAPNFYLYFPLSEEVHNFNFVLHSNAFYKASSRTFLHKGSQGEDGINERLLRVIAHRLESELREIYDRKEYTKFLDFFAALLTSSESQVYERQWVKNPFIDEITKVLKKLIPVRKSMDDDQFELTAVQPRIKRTNIEISPDIFGLPSFNWFFWGPDSPIIIREKAFQKLNPHSFDIFTLFQKKEISNHVNKWIQTDTTRVNLIFDELQYFNKEKVQTENFKNNLKALKLFLFNDGLLLSDNDIVEMQDSGYLIMHNNLVSIKDELIKAYLKTSSTNLDDYDFFRYYSPYLNPNGQLRSQVKIIEIISKGNVEHLQPSEKMAVFIALRDMIDDKKIERLSELRLFKNSQGECVKLKNLLKSSEKTWLKPFIINNNERHKDFEHYLLSDDSKVYENIVLPFWQNIAERIIQTNPAERTNIFTEIEKYFESRGNKEEFGNLSEETKTLFFQGSNSEVESPFYHSHLNRLSEDSYVEIQQLLNKHFKIQIPDREFLKGYDYEFLTIENNPDCLEHDQYTFNNEEVVHFLQFAGVAGIDVFSNYHVSDNNDFFTVVKSTEKNYFSKGNSQVDEYIAQYHNNRLVKLPESLSQFGNLVPLKNEQLYSELVRISKEENTDELIEVIGTESLSVKIQLFNKVNKVVLQFNSDDISSNKSKLSFLTEVIGDEGLDLEIVQNKISILTDTYEIKLSEIDIANDQITINHAGNPIQLSRSKLLNLENEKSIPTIISFAESAVQQSLLTERASKKLFKISSENISNELESRVISSIGEQNNSIKNTDQLILIIDSALEGKTDIKNYKVETVGGNWMPLDGNYVFHNEHDNSHYYNEDSVLSRRYNDFTSKLNLRSESVYFYSKPDSGNESDHCQSVIYPEFTFQNGVSPDVLKKNENIIDTIEFLFDQWKKTPAQNRIKLDKVGWENVFGFKPCEKVVSHEVLESEVLDEEILDWLETNRIDKERFLSHVGFNISDSKISKFRKWLLNAPDNVLNPNSIDDLSLVLLSNTLIGLADGFKNVDAEFACRIKSNKHQVIEKLIEKLIESKLSFEIRLPIWKNETTVCLGEESINIPFFIDSEALTLLSKEENKNTFVKLIEDYRIIFPSEDYKNFAESCYPEIDLSIEFNDCESQIEHNEPFYITWARDNNIKLYRCDRLIYLLHVTDDEGTKEIGEIEIRNVEVREDENNQTLIYYQRALSFEMLVEELQELDYEEDAELVEVLINSRDKILSAFYHALTSSGRDGFDFEDSNKILEALNERSLDEKRNEIIEGIKNSEKYSYDWFMNYMEYLLTFEELSDTISQKSISFQKIERFFSDGIPSKKYFTLKGANSLIPLNIEAFENFSISLVFAKNIRENMIIEGVSKKGQDLLVYVPKGIDEKLMANFDHVINISINFTPVLDLLQRLAKAFSNKDVIAPWDDIKNSLPPLHFIYGPPGTGKTTKLVNTLIEKFEEEPTFKALILVPTNKAGDVLAKRLVQQNLQIGVLRIGGPTDPELEQIDEDIYQISVDENMFDSNNIIITTIHRLPYYQISVQHGANFKLFDQDKVNWDLVIFDESSMIGLTYFAFALNALHSNGKIIIAGDPKQIPAVVDVSDKKLEELEMSDESIYKMLSIESFDRKQQNLRSIDSIDNLEIQFRSVEEIGQLFSKISYNSLLKHGRNFEEKPVKQLPDTFYAPLKSKISFIDLPLDVNNSIMEPKKLLYSPYHVYSGIIAAELIAKLDKSIEGNKQYTIGIISPYKAQAMLINKLITSSGISNNISVFCDTVHGFQGDECDIILFVLNPNNSYFTGHPNSLLSKEYIYNVAISRAKDHLWIICPFNAIKNNPHVNNLIEVAGNNKSIVQADSLEKYLFGEKDYILKNTYLTGHDNINVFGQVEMSYFIKAGATAIDIQLRK